MIGIPDAVLGERVDVARSVEMARRAAAMDVVPAWAMVSREGPIADVAPPLPVMRESDERAGAEAASREDGEA